LAGHFIADYFHYDSKFFRSLVPLFTKPGFLTKQYWEGKRVHYIHPLRLFFFITIVFIISTTYFYRRFGSELKKEFSYQDKVLPQLDTTYFAKTPGSKKIFLRGDSITIDSVRHEINSGARRMGKLQTGMDHVFVNLKYVMFLLLPLYALVFKVLYRRQKHFYVDHLVYMMHLQCFAYVILGLLFLIPFITPISIFALRQIAFFTILIYIFISLHNLYHQKVWKTVLKSILATVTLFFITFLSVLMVAAIDAMFVQ
jgi:hypothetical protein